MEILGERLEAFRAEVKATIGDRILSESFVTVEVIHSMEFVVLGVWVATSITGLTMSAGDIAGMYLLFSFVCYQYLCFLECFMGWGKRYIWSISLML